MRLKVELSDDVAAYLKRLSNVERSEFVEGLEAIRREPIKNSERAYRPDISRYMLRRFDFGSHRAVFELDFGRNKVTIYACDSLKKRVREE
jgi:hypothetical protein